MFFLLPSVKPSTESILTHCQLDFRNKLKGNGTGNQAISFKITHMKMSAILLCLIVITFSHHFINIAEDSLNCTFHGGDRCGFEVDASNSHGKWTLLPSQLLEDIVDDVDSVAIKRRSWTGHVTDTYFVCIVGHQCPGKCSCIKSYQFQLGFNRNMFLDIL